ncbi:YdcH family protein [Vibrio sp. DNB22_12_1]|uniref:YdcH family protein n=1 Tax=unclassified Vibrio TaxID=2614977 RepID=UPI00406A2895
MLGENHSLTHEFPEHLDTINQLVASDASFAETAKNYNALDKEIRELELRGNPIDDNEMNTLKHNRAELKDWLYSKIMSA